MIQVLIHRLEAGAGPDIALDADILHWLAECVTGGQTQRWLDHSFGLAGNLDGARRLVHDILDVSAWSVTVRRHRTGLEADACVLVRGAPAPFVGRSEDAACSLLAAALRAFAAYGVQKATVNDGVAA